MWFIFWPLSSPFCSFKIKSYLSFSDSGPKELPLPRFMMSKTDGEIRFGNTAELHGTKVQIPFLISEKNTFKRMDDEDKQVNSMIRHAHLILTMKPHVAAVPHVCCQASSKSHCLEYSYRLGSEPVKFICSKKKRWTHRNCHEPPMDPLEPTLMSNRVQSKVANLAHLFYFSNPHFQMGSLKCNL